MHDPLPMNCFTDAHSHRIFPSGVSGVRSLFRPEEFSSDNLPSLFSAGIHPLYAGPDAKLPPSALLTDSRCAAIGETGLDRRADLPLSVQTELFRKHAEIAETLRKPLIVHAVRTQQELLRFRRDFAPSMPWILHGFRGNERKTFELLEAGFMLSFGEGLLRDAGTLCIFFERIPLDRILLETDDSGMDVRILYAEAASMHGLDPETFRSAVKTNFERMFLR